jgi:hypothetical protein
MNPLRHQCKRVLRAVSISPPPPPAMRDFLALFAVLYLADPVLFWVGFGAFYRWYDDSTPWWSWGVQLACALLGALLMRLLQQRWPSLIGTWTAAPLQQNEAIRNIGTAILVVFPGLVGYGDMIELTGSPDPDEQFPVGRVRSLFMIAILLVGVFALVSKWKDLLTASDTTYHLHPPDLAWRSTPGASVLRANVLAPTWLVHLGVLLGLCILGDIFAHQNWGLNVVLAGSLVVLVFVVLLRDWLWEHALGVEPHSVHRD